MKKEEVKVRFRLTQTHRTALFQESSKGNFDQTGWGTTVKLIQVRNDNMTAPMTLVLSGEEAKIFEDAQPGAEFEVIVKPAKSE